jgi:hypothetical protein
MEKIPTIVKEMHDGVGGGHFTTNITIRKLLDVKYWWPTMHNDILNYCQTCNQC